MVGLKAADAPVYLRRLAREDDALDILIRLFLLHRARRRARTLASITIRSLWRAIGSVASDRRLPARCRPGDVHRSPWNSVPSLAGAHRAGRNRKYPQNENEMRPKAT